MINFNLHRHKFDILVIGAGIFGQIITATLRKKGADVGIIDAGFEGSGSKPAACLMKPSWFSSLGKENYKPALQTLDESYRIRGVEFKVGPVTTEVLWIPPEKILSEPFIKKAVVELAKPDSKWRVTTHDGQEYTAGQVILATGVWANTLIQRRVPGLAAKTGVAFLWPKGRIEQPFIRPWAPFKQIVAFNRGDGLWVGDGSAILEKNWTTDRRDQSARRCATAVMQYRTDATALVGNRPYADTSGEPCYLAEHDGVTVVTGGAKNGTIAAGWAAYHIARRLT